MKAGSEGSQWRVHGVSRGIRDRYYKFTMGEDPDMPFRVHRFMAMHRPSWGPEERKNKISMYGGTSDNVDYRRNIYGEHGDATNPVFVLARLMGVCAHPGVHLGDGVQRPALPAGEDQRRAAPLLRCPGGGVHPAAQQPAVRRLLLLLGRHGRRVHPRPLRDPRRRRHQAPGPQEHRPAAAPGPHPPDADLGGRPGRGGPVPVRVLRGTAAVLRDGQDRQRPALVAAARPGGCRNAR